MKNIFKWLSIILCFITFAGILWIFLTEGKTTYWVALAPTIVNVIVITLYVILNRVDKK